MAAVTGKSIAAPAQYKQPSRKGKKAWRKNVDVSDVQAGLEEAREEVIKGGIIAEKPSDALFTLDTTGSSSIQKSYNKLHKPLKADQILAQRSAVPSIDSHKRPSGITDGVIEPSSKKRKTNGVSPKEYERLRQVAYNGSSVKDVVEMDEDPSEDLWAEDPHEGVQDPRFDYLEKKKPIVAPKTLKESPISIVEGGKAVKAVPKPKAGTSYNPEFQEWSARYQEEGEKEVAREKKRIADAKVELERLERIAAAELEMERDEGVQTEDESAWEGIESDAEGAEWLTKKRPERKTPAERKKTERKKERARAEKAEKRAKEREKREKQILEIRRQVDKEAARKLLGMEVAKAKNENAEEEEEVDDTVLRRRKLGKDALPEAPLELVLPDELQESLRLLKPEGNLLKDRFRNIMIRGKLETRKPIQQPKKKRRTLTEKWTYKDFKVGA